MVGEYKGIRRYRKKSDGSIIYALQWQGAETYNKGRHYLAPGDYFTGPTPDITPYRSVFVQQITFDEGYELAE